MQKWRKQQKNHELIIGLVHQVGTDHTPVIPWLKELMGSCSYDLNEIHITKAVMPEIAADLLPPKGCDEFNRINTFIDAGNKIRERYNNDAILALGAISQILNWRNTNAKNFPTRTMHLITSLKHPEEVSLLREVYGSAFFLIGVYADESIRRKNLLRLCSKEQVDKLIERDTEEHQTHGQHTRDTFFLSDFFLPLDSDINLSKNALFRFIDLLFGNPFITPTLMNLRCSWLLAPHSVLLTCPGKSGLWYQLIMKLSAQEPMTAPELEAAFIGHNGKNPSLLTQRTDGTTCAATTLIECSVTKSLRVL